MGNECQCLWVLFMDDENIKKLGSGDIIQL